MRLGWSIGLIALAMVARAPAQVPTDDPYLWLEPFDTPAVMKWVHAENDKTLGVLQQDPHFERLYQDALAIAQSQDRIPAPTFLGGAVYNFWQDKDHVRGIWRRTSAADFGAAEPHWHTVLDLDAYAKSEGANWVWKEAVCEGKVERRCMLLLSDGGEDAVTAREFDLKSGRVLDKGFLLPHGKQRVAWEDENTLLVAREFAPGDLTKSGYPYVVKRLKRGQALSGAREVFRGSADDGGYGVEPTVLRDRAGHRAIVIQRPRTTFEFEYYLLTPKGALRLALPAKADIEALVGGQLVVNLKEDWSVGGASFASGSLVALDLAAATRDPATLHPVAVFAPGPREAINQVAASGDALVVNVLENVRGRLLLFRPQAGGAWAREAVALPDNSALSINDADVHGTRAYVTVTGFLQPSTLWEIDTQRAGAERVKALQPKFDASRDVVEQFEAPSSDGVRIPYFVVHRADLARDGSNPTVLNAYGGFDIAMTPRYLSTIGKLWLEQGGVFVLANIRGGGEFGPAWHEAGLKTHRQIIYDDFAAVARDLFARGITSPRRLGITGGSNGGLLMGVEMTQHPELWQAVDIAVPLLDMLRFEQIAAGTSWVGEYGSVANPDERAFLASISPYAALKREAKYPEPFVWTTTKDDRVGPQHARKFAARLAEYGHPYLFYEVTEGGHGAGANLAEKARTSALEWTYFTRKLMSE